MGSASVKKNSGSERSQGGYGWLVFCLVAAVMLIGLGVYRSTGDARPSVIKKEVLLKKGDESYPGDWFYESELSDRFPEGHPEQKTISTTAMTMTVTRVAPLELPEEIEAVREDPQVFNDKLAELYGE